MEKKVAIITAGGTREYIDDVRFITNSSTGRLGSLIAKELREQLGDKVEIIYLHSKDAILPNFYVDEYHEFSSCQQLNNLITKLLSDRNVNYFIHSAAVSDYTLDYISKPDSINVPILNEGKIDSSEESIALVLKRNEKIINKIKKLSPYTFLVGFKLLSAVDRNTLFEKGFKTLRYNRCNLVLANDIATIRLNNHTGMLIYPEKVYDEFIGKDNIAKNLVKVMIKRENVKHPKSIKIKDNSEIPFYILDAMKNVSSNLEKDNFLPKVDCGTYGNMSIFNKDKSFYITGRNVNKLNLAYDDIVKIENVEYLDEPTVYSKVFYNGSVKPSIDSTIHSKIYEALGNEEEAAILHVHSEKEYLGIATTKDSYPCGSKEECDSILKLFNGLNTIQMKKHGLILIDDNLTNCYYKLEKITRKTPAIQKYDDSVESHRILKKELNKHYEDVNAYDLPIKLISTGTNFVVSINNKDIGIMVIEGNNFCLYIAEEHRNSGYGPKIIKEFENHLALQGYETINLITADKCGVINFYKKLNYIETFVLGESKILTKTLI